MDILIKNVLLNNELTDIYIQNNYIQQIGKNLNQNAGTILDGTGKAAIPGFINGHTHSAMTLMRGYADDMSLQEWLRQKIWPLEARLTEEDVYWGSKLACLEMIKSGTTFFNDMYWHPGATAKAASEMGIRAAISGVFFDFNDPAKCREQILKNEKLLSYFGNNFPSVQFTLGPHAIYTVSKQGLQWVSDFARANHLLIQIHVSETQDEVSNCLHMQGMRPIEYLHSIGFFKARVMAVHSIWLSENEIQIMAANQVTPVYNPASNLKLASGIGFPYPAMKKHGLKPILGTDGCSSNNHLDMFATMKIAALVQKGLHNDPTVLPAQTVFDMATTDAAKAFNLPMGSIVPGNLADLSLVNLALPELTPCHHLISNLVFAANGSCVDTVICNGKIVMQNRQVDGEAEILKQCNKIALDLPTRKTKT